MTQFLRLKWGLKQNDSLYIVDSNVTKSLLMCNQSCTTYLSNIFKPKSRCLDYANAGYGVLGKGILN